MARRWTYSQPTLNIVTERSNNERMKPTTVRRNKRIAETVLGILTAKYPKCFTLDEPKPLAIGIGGTIIAAHPEIKPWMVDQALRSYTTAIPYLEKLTVDAPRIDLAGCAAGTVSADEAAHARVQVRVARAKARKASRAVGGSQAAAA